MDVLYVWLIAALGWIAASVFLLAGIMTDRRLKNLHKRLNYVRKVHEKDYLRPVNFSGTYDEITEMITAAAQHADFHEALWYAEQLKKDLCSPHKQGTRATTLFIDKDKANKVRNLFAQTT